MLSAQPRRRPRPVVTGAERLQQRVAHRTADRAGQVGDELVVTRVGEAHVELGVELVELLHGQPGVVHPVQRRPHPVELRRCGVLRGELGTAALQHHAGLDDVCRAEAGQRQVQPQQAGQRLAGQGGDDRRRAGSGPDRPEHALGLQHAHALADGRAAGPEQGGQLALRREVVAGLQRAGQDLLLDRLDHELIGERAGDRPPRRGSTGDVFGHTV
jgi:hypothetical protein